MRTDLGIAAKSGREARRAPLPTFAHLTDMHVLDAQSPARVEFLDRSNDNVPDGLLIASYRPHEFLTAAVADTMAATVKSLGPGPVSKRKPGVRDQHRRRRRQLPAERAALGHRPARRRQHAARRFR